MNLATGQNNNKEKYTMFRIIILFILTIFLFAGLAGTANVLFSDTNADTENVIAQVSEKKDTRLSIKEIESITAANNYSFTQFNALR